MKSETKLDSAVFQLTPTRTRCELVIIANGKTDKVASGLVNPFLSHLKTAQDQYAIGGYSIKLEPDPAADATWFTKESVERFVRFVSTPEVLERVITIESEIVQIEVAISAHGNDTGEEHLQMKPIRTAEGNKRPFDADTEKSIILYKPGSDSHPPESNGFRILEENSKVQLLRVLESRKKVLQKEQAMAFARSAAAGFDMEILTCLMSFAKSFGASRLMEACTQYMLLWKGKHETGQWIEVEAAEALSYRSEFSPLNSSGIVFSGDATRQKELVEMWPTSTIETCTESNGNTASQYADKDKRHLSDIQAHLGPDEYYQAQFQHPAFSPWPVLSQPSPHGFQPYPMQAMPYYPNYPMNGHFFIPHPTPMEDSRFNTPKKNAKKKYSINSKDSTFASEDGTVESTEFEEEPSKDRSSHQKVGHSKTKKGVAVNQNINCIAGKGQETSGTDSESSIEETKESLSDNGEFKQKSLKPSNRKVNHVKSLDILNVYGKDEEIYFQEPDNGEWQTFQSFLMKAEERMASVVNEEIMAGEKKSPVKQGQNLNTHDPIFLCEMDSCISREESITEYDAISGKCRQSRQVDSVDAILVSQAGRGLQDEQIATHFEEVECHVGYRKATSDAFLAYGPEKQLSSGFASDPIVDCEHEHGAKSEGSSQNMSDESFMVPFRPGSQDLLGVDRRLTIDLDSEYSISHRNEDSSSKETTRGTHEPDDLTLMLGRTRESESIGYGPVIDYDIQASLVVKHESEKKEDAIEEKKLNSYQVGLEKKSKDVMMTKMSSSRSTPLTEAQKRAEKLRNYRADLQKMKKEQELLEMKRLESLKRERQKRIAARSGFTPVQSPSITQKHKPVKVTVSAHESSKVTESEPVSNSPLQRLPRNTSSIESTGSDKVSNARPNGFISSISSLPLKEERSSASERIKRLSEPRGKVGTKKEERSASEQVQRFSEPKEIIARGIPEKLLKNTTQVMKKPLTEPSLKKVSAIIQLDRTKSETLPELKLKTDRIPSEEDKKKSEISLMSEKKIEKTPNFRCNDGNSVVEKSVVMLQNETVFCPPAQTSERNLDSKDTGYAILCAPPSPVYGVEIENPTEGACDDRLNSYEIIKFEPKDESVLLLGRAEPEKLYQAPYARSTSLEDPDLDLCSVIQFDETQEKVRNKESKGIRKLWKFGRKDHSSGSSDDKLDANALVNHILVTSTSSDVSTLKHQISHDESNLVGTETKVSGSFSILGSFRGRNKEKKVAI